MTDYNETISNLPNDVKQIVELTISLGIAPSTSQQAARIATQFADGRKSQSKTLEALTALQQGQ